VTHPLRIKICGITNEADAVAASELGADAVGLNFYAKSPRFVQPLAVPHILQALPPFVVPVAVFVTETLKEMCNIAGSFGLIRTVQRHGDQHEPGDAFPFRLIEVFRVGDSLDEVRRYLDLAAQHELLPAALLIDSSAPGQFGGSGKTAPWELLAEFKTTVPLILAGGLTPENVAEAVRIVRPYGVDVASGVESSPGRKDVDKMKRFIDNARSAV
jgi:phosphoribosylanthranilate isomerase